MNICLDCAKQISNKAIRCDVCAYLHKKQMAKMRYEAAKGNGLCPYCKKRKPEPGKSKCAVCEKKQVHQRRKHRRKEQDKRTDGLKEVFRSYGYAV